MGGYLANFSVYTFAMVGFLFVAVAVYKKACVNTQNKTGNGKMEIEDSLSLSPRKRLHVVRVNGEKFLIAADVERTEFLAKLDDNTQISAQKTTQNPIQTNNNVITLNKHPELFSKQENKFDVHSDKISEKVTSILKNIEKRKETVKTIQTKGNTALNIEPKQYGETKLSHIKSINMKKQPMMRSILNKLEVAQG